MSIANFITRACKQTIVYWGSPVEDGYGGYTYDDPVEILGRWEEVNEVILGSNGKEMISQVRVFLTQEVDTEGAMWLGALADLDSAPAPDDSDVSALYVIAFNKIPILGSADEYIYKAHLNMSGRTSV